MQIAALSRPYPKFRTNDYFCEIEQFVYFYGVNRSVMIAQFIKFCVVGGSGVVVDFAITYLLKEKLRLNKYIANSTGFVCAASTNYLLNRLWTFQSHDPQVTRQYMLFLAIALDGWTCAPRLSATPRRMRRVRCGTILKSTTSAVRPWC